MGKANAAIYRRLPNNYTYTANLTTAGIYCPYFGLSGETLPAGSSASTPKKVKLRYPIDHFKRKELMTKLAAAAPVTSAGLAASGAKISYGTCSEVQADITAKFGAAS